MIRLSGKKSREAIEQALDDHADISTTWWYPAQVALSTRLGRQLRAAGASEAEAQQPYFLMALAGQWLLQRLNPPIRQSLDQFRSNIRATCGQIGQRVEIKNLVVVHLRLAHDLGLNGGTHGIGQCAAAGALPCIEWRLREASASWDSPRCVYIMSDWPELAEKLEKQLLKANISHVRPTAERSIGKYHSGTFHDLYKEPVKLAQTVQADRGLLGWLMMSEASMRIFAPNGTFGRSALFRGSLNIGTDVAALDLLRTCASWEVTNPATAFNMRSPNYKCALPSKSYALGSQ